MVSYQHRSKLGSNFKVISGTPPVAGSTTTQITRVTSDLVQEINFSDKKYKLDDYAELLENEEVINAILEVKILRAAASLGKYAHPKDEATQWILGNFSDMKGDLNNVVGRLATASYFGFNAGEIVFNDKVPGYRNEWRLGGINVLDVLKTSFAGTRRGVTHIIDKSHPELGKVCLDTNGNKYKKGWIPIAKCLHISTGSLGGDPFGKALARRAMPYWKAKKILLSEWVVAGKNQSAGLLLGFTDSNDTVTLLGPDGQPARRGDGSIATISAVQNMVKAIERLDETNFLITDLKNRLQWQPMSVDSGFFQTVLQYIDRKLLLTQLAPSLTFDEGSGQFGNTSVAMVQKTMLDSQIASIVTQIKDQIIEKVVKPLLQWNFGYTSKDGWGDFEVDASGDPNSSAMKAQMLMGAMAQQIVPTSDPQAMNALRELLGLPHQKESDMLEAVQKSVQLQVMQQQMMQQAQSQDPAAQKPADAQQTDSKDGQQQQYP